MHIYSYFNFFILNHHSNSIYRFDESSTDKTSEKENSSMCKIL